MEQQSDESPKEPAEQDRGWFSGITEFFQSEPVQTARHWFFFAGTRFAVGYLVFKAVERLFPNDSKGPPEESE